MKKIQKKLLLLLLTIFLTGCMFSKHSPERKFSDSKVIKLCKAAKAGDTEKIDQLIDEGVDINTVGIDGMNPLFWLLVMNEESEAKKRGFRHLLKKGANVLQVAKPGTTVLHLSAQYIDLDYLKMILEEQPNVDINFQLKDKSWDTPLLNAKASDRYENFVMLVEHGANIEQRDHSDYTPLMSSSINGSWKYAYYLLQNGADYKVGLKDGKYKIVRSLEYYRYWPSVAIKYHGTDYRQKVIDFLREEGVEVNPWMPEEDENLEIKEDEKN